MAGRKTSTSAHWPIDDTELRALVDAGLSAGRNAEYFSVPPWVVELALELSVEDVSMCGVKR
jgi:hypothetical protein